MMVPRPSREVIDNNTMGQRVRSLASSQQAGNQEFALGSLPAGTYLVKLQIGDQVTSKMVVME